MSISPHSQEGYPRKRDNYETAEAAKQANEELLRELRAENVELRKKFAAFRQAAQAQGAATDDEVEVACETHKASKLRVECDRIIEEANQKEKEVIRLRDEAAILEQQAKRPAAEDTPMGRKIRMLENRLDKAMIKFNEAQSIRKTYEQIVKKLQEERVGFDNQLTALEGALNAKSRDVDELVLIAANAMHARDFALADLENAKVKYRDDRISRERQLRERAVIRRQREQAAIRAEQREKLRKDYVAKAAGDLGEEEEENLKRNYENYNLASNRIGAEVENTKESLDKYEEAFRKIKESTGVSDVNEVITKIISQGDTEHDLQNLSKENQIKIDKLTVERDELKNKVEEIKYAIGGGRTGSRKIVDELERSMTDASAELERQKAKYERLTKILIEAKAGINHLNQKLKSVMRETQQNSFDSDRISDIIARCEDTLVMMLNKIKEEGIELQSNMQNIAVSTRDIDASRPYNRRIPLGGDNSGNGTAVADDEESDDEGEANDELGRDEVKKASESIIRESKLKAKRKLKHGRHDDDF